MSDAKSFTAQEVADRHKQRRVSGTSRHHEQTCFHCHNTFISYGSNSGLCAVCDDRD